MKKLFILLLFAAFAVSCSNSTTIENSSWDLMELGSEKLDRSALEDTISYTITFMVDSTGVKQVNGKGECNYFFGEYTNDAAAKTIELGNLGVTRAMCPNMEREDAYIKALMSSDTYEIKGNELILKSGANTAAKFTKKAANK